MGKPPMDEPTRQRAIAATDKHRERFATPRLAIGGEDGAYSFDCPYSDEDAKHWQALLFEAFGTRSISTATVFLRQLASFVGNGWDDTDKQWRPKVEELNAAIGIVASTEPRNEAEAALAAQMVALHLTAMGLASNCARQAYPDERTAATLARCAKVYASLQLALARLQGKIAPRQVNQTIQVIYLDQRDQRQQAVVMGGAGDFGGQAHSSPDRRKTLTHDEERAIESGSPTNARCAALPSPCSDDGATVPLGGGEGKAGLPNARWIAWLWRAFG